MKDNGFYQGAVDSFKDEKYLDAVEKVNKKYLPAELVEEYEKAPIVDGEPFDGLWNALD